MKYEKQFSLYVVRIPDVIHDLMAMIDVVMVTALDVVTRLYLRDQLNEIKQFRKEF